MADRQPPSVQLALVQPRDLSDIQKWADLAEALNFPSNSPVDLSLGGQTLTVRAFLSRVDVPDPTDQEQ